MLDTGLPFLYALYSTGVILWLSVRVWLLVSLQVLLVVPFTLRTYSFVAKGVIPHEDERT